MASANEEECATNAADNVDIVSQLFRVPQMWPKNIKLWFIVLETYFKVTHITSDQTKFIVLIEYLGSLFRSSRGHSDRPAGDGKIRTAEERSYQKIDRFGEFESAEIARERRNWR